MPTYLTVREVAAIFRTTEKTVREWAREKPDFSFDGKRYKPEKDPSGAWLFVVTIIRQQEEEYTHKPIGPYPRRRVISSGIK